MMSAVSCQAQEAKAAGGSGAAEPHKATLGPPELVLREESGTWLRHPCQGAPGSVSMTEIQEHAKKPTMREPHNGPAGVGGGSPHLYPHHAQSVQARPLPSGTGFTTWGDAY